ncbi:hypothetical protein [Flavobacterium sp. NKUCC04_CG]|uniref:hypothetical protein n=1 Tax=Flavobacterium sp. NKUCC04_CG TaxID=2842121 RepID=UPI001C5B4EF8|nr:hypothetical protein [Flavobacterium sp. NKUCC04_CG]MBW3517549.1 hypothetical protein [Flavobacterium sp. NKUCC04_CG]
MKKIFLLAITCFFVNQANALGSLTIINGTSNDLLHFKGYAANTTSCYPELGTQDNLSAWAGYMDIGPNTASAVTYNNFAAFSAFSTGLRFTLQTSIGGPVNTILPAQAQAYASLVAWNRVAFKIDIFGTGITEGTHLGLPETIACHGLDSYSQAQYTYASFFTIGGTNTYFIVS